MAIFVVDEFGYNDLYRKSGDGEAFEISSTWLVNKAFGHSGRNKNRYSNFDPFTN